MGDRQDVSEALKSQHSHFFHAENHSDGSTNYYSRYSAHPRKNVGIDDSQIIQQFVQQVRCDLHADVPSTDLGYCMHRDWLLYCASTDSPCP